jgi:hypothetical protein
MSTQKWYKNPEMIIALSALFIGLVTAFTSIYSAYVDRTYSRASVWPRLEIFRSVNVDSFSYGIANNGTGPALIKYAKVKSGTQYLQRWSDVKQFNNIRQSYMSNRTLSPQKAITPLSYKGESVKALKNVDDTISIELCYCSVYEECWLIDRENTPTPIESCVINEKQAFLQ